MNILKSSALKLIAMLLLSMACVSCSDQSVETGVNAAKDAVATVAANTEQQGGAPMGGPPQGGPGQGQESTEPPPQGAPGTMEVALVDRLNGNDNHYCIDTMGARDRAVPADGLQAYTCYTDQGYVGYDQAMDPAAIAKGQFLMTGFNVCMQAKAKTAGAMIGAEACDGNQLQNFDLRDDQTIRLKTAGDLCLDVGDETRFGRGGPTGHQYKDLTLAVCSEQRSAHQQWYLRDSM